MTLHLSLKFLPYDSIVAGTKVNEYRELNSYYTQRLVVEQSDVRPKNTEGFVRCSNGRWYKFHKYDFVKFYKGKTGASATFRIKAIDVDRNNFIIRLGERCDN